MHSSRIVGRFLSSLERCAVNGDLAAWYTGVSAFLERRSSPSTNLDSALLTELLRQSELARAHLRSRPARLWWAYLVERVFGLMCRDISAPTGSAVEYSLASKARLLLDHMHEPYCVANDQMRRQSVSLFGFSSDESESLSKLNDIGRISMIWPTEISINPLIPKAQVEALERAYLREQAGFSASPTPPELKHLQSQLLDNELIIDYVAPNTHNIKNDVYISVITKTFSATTRADMLLLPDSGTITMMRDGRTPIDINRLTVAIAGSRNSIENGDDDAALPQIQRLYEVLVRPIERLGIDVREYSHWTISPHGAMHAVPWNAVICIGQHPKDTQISISVVPSLGVWSALVARAPNTSRRFAAFVDPTEDLEGAAAEGDVIRVGLQGYHGEVYSGARATAETFRERAPSTAIIHVAGHGEFPDSNGLDSHALLLAGGKENAHPVLASELRDMDFTTELVTLNVCDGASYRVGPGSEPYGLVAGFLAGGCRNVLGTLWPVSDSAALEFSERFFGNVLETGPATSTCVAAAALAQREPMRDWACYVTVGPGRTLPA